MNAVGVIIGRVDVGKELGNFVTIAVGRIVESAEIGTSEE